MVEVAGVEPVLGVHVFALICICSYLTASCGLAKMHLDESRCT